MFYDLKQALCRYLGETPTTSFSRGDSIFDCTLHHPHEEVTPDNVQQQEQREILRLLNTCQIPYEIRVRPFANYAMITFRTPPELLKSTPSHR